MFWGAIFTDSRGGRGLVRWQNGLDQLEVMNYDLAKIAEIKKLNNPDDGKWWKDSDIKEETVFGGEATIKGKFMYKDGTPIEGKKMLLVGDYGSTSDKTDKNGAFSFKKLLPGFYELFVVDGDEKVATGFSSYVFDGDIVTFNVINDTTGYVVDTPESENQTDDYTTDTEGEDVEEIVASGNLKGTVYTPTLDTVEGLKVVLRGVGEVVTDENGSFGFANIPVGEYDLYAVNSDGSEYLFKKYTIKENVNLEVKLKYAPTVEGNTDETDNGWLVWVIVASVVALLVVAGLVFFLIFKKKKTDAQI